MLREVTATRYVTPLREGGSLPGLMEADDLGTYVVKFTGAGQGVKALSAEIIATSLAGRLGLPVADLVLVDVDPALAANEPDDEVQDLLRRSPGRNLGVDYLPGALDLDAEAFAIDARFAGRVVWFDALVGNVDRSWRNPNMLFWHRRPYLIDHGAALTFHHSWSEPVRPYDAGEHALIRCEPDLDAADQELAPLVTDDLLSEITALVPSEWLTDADSPDAERRRYVDAVLARLGARRYWLAAAHEAAAVGGRKRISRRARPAWLGPAGVGTRS